MESRIRTAKFLAHDVNLFVLIGQFTAGVVSAFTDAFSHEKAASCVMFLELESSIGLPIVQLPSPALKSSVLGEPEEAECKRTQIGGRLQSGVGQMFVDRRVRGRRCGHPRPGVCLTQPIERFPSADREGTFSQNDS